MTNKTDCGTPVIPPTSDLDEEDCMFDENEIGQIFEAETIELDSADIATKPGDNVSIKELDAGSDNLGLAVGTKKIAPDSASSRRMVFNLFIEGEEPEVVEEDEEEDESKRP